MDIKCPHCGTEYEVEKKYMYRYTKCQSCGKGFVAGAATSLQADESKNIAVAASLNGKDLSQKSCSPLVAIKRQSAVNAKHSSVTSKGAEFADAGMFSADEKLESSSTHQPPVQRLRFAPRKKEEPAPLSVPTSPANVATNGARALIVVWYVIVSMFFVVMVLAMCAVFFIYEQGRECRMVQERLENSIKELNCKVVSVEAETGKIIDAIAKEHEERLSALRESVEQAKINVKRGLDDLEHRIASSEGNVKKSQEAIQ